MINYKHEIIEPGEGVDPKNVKNSVNNLKATVVSEIKTSESNLMNYCIEKLKKKVDIPKTEESKKAEEHPSSTPEGEGDKPKLKIELIPAGYQEEVQKVSIQEEDGAYGYLDHPEPKQSWYNFESYAKNTTLIDYKKTTVGHLLICALKHIGQKDKEIPELQGVIDENLYELEKLLKHGLSKVRLFLFDFVYFENFKFLMHKVL